MTRLNTILLALAIALYPVFCVCSHARSIANVEQVAAQSCCGDEESPSPESEAPESCRNMICGTGMPIVLDLPPSSEIAPAVIDVERPLVLALVIDPISPSLYINHHPPSITLVTLRTMLLN